MLDTSQVFGDIASAHQQFALDRRFWLERESKSYHYEPLKMMLELIEISYRIFLMEYVRLIWHCDLNR